MRKLFIEAKDYLPGILFDPDQDRFEITGKSRPENIKSYFDPIFNWLDDFFQPSEFFNKYSITKPFILKFEVDYFNSTSAKMFFSIIKKLRFLQDESIPFEIHWYYDKDDEDTKENGEDMAEETGYEIKLIEK